MATACIDLTIPTTCISPLPETDFNICAPVVNVGEIEEILFTNIGSPLTDETSPTEWATRKGLPAIDPTKIISLICQAEKPAATANEITISQNIIITPSKEHVINGDVHQTNDKNYNAMRQFEFARKVLIWYRTAGGKLYGGPKGIEASISINEVIPKSRKELSYFAFTIKWEAKLHPCRTNSPF